MSDTHDPEGMDLARSLARLGALPPTPRLGGALARSPSLGRGDSGAPLPPEHIGRAALAGHLDRRLSEAALRRGTIRVDEPIGRYIREVREAAGVSAAEWAGRLGIDPGWLAQAEGGDHGLLRLMQRPDALAALADAAEIPRSRIAAALRHAAFAAAGSPRRSAHRPGESSQQHGPDPASQARMERALTELGRALRARDRDDLL